MKKKHIIATCVIIICIAYAFLSFSNERIEANNEYGNSGDLNLEAVISRRISIKRTEFYSDVEVPSEVVSKVLWASCGYSSGGGRTVPSLCTNYPLMVYVCNTTGCYKFVPETRSLTLWKLGNYRAVGGGIMAPILLYIVLNTDYCGDIQWGNAESGCMIQSIYLMANALNLGTVCLGGSWLDRTYIHQELGLPENEEVLYKMPLGYLNPPYEDYRNLVPTSRPSSQELPEIQDSDLSIAAALDSVFSSHQWSENPITKQEISQLLWASYGYSYYADAAASSHPMNISTHRTVPSARAFYPLIIYAVNSTGVFKYVPEEHTITMTLSGDRRSKIAAACGHTWLSSAPLIIGLVWNEASMYNENTTYCEVGLVTQNIYLESAAWGLIADWGKADTQEEAMRQALGLTGETHLHPASVITIGHPATYLHKAEWKETIYNVETKTNSTILDFAFDQPKREISFNVHGPSDITGFCNVTIPKTLLWGNFTVLMDRKLSTTLTQSNNATHTSLYFTYELLSTLNVQIIGEYAIPGFQTWALVLILLILTFVLLYKRKKLWALRA